jgi:hypothetical protein
MAFEFRGDNMKVGICSVAVLMGAIGIVTNAAAVPESNSTTQDQSSLTPLIPTLIPTYRVGN